MNNTIKYVGIFVVGAGIGAFTTNKLLKTKYEQFAQEQIDSVKETFSNGRTSMVIQNVKDSDIQEKAKQAKEKPAINEYASRVQKHGYVDYSAISAKQPPKKEEPEIEEENSGDGEDNEEKEQESGEVPYVISPEEFGEMDGYDKIGLNYFSDGILADDDDERVDDIDEIVGADSVNHFGEYEDDSVFVRNDRLKCDYEILYDQRKYSDVIKKKPHQIEE